MPNLKDGKAVKLNLGCGYNKIDGFINVDKMTMCNPDVVFDIEASDWPWEHDSVHQVLFNHSLEHVGADASVFLRIMQELYRVCAPNAVVEVNAPHPRHDHFITDPTHVRAITPDLFCLFDLDQNRKWIEAGFANSPLAIYMGIDFVLNRVRIIYTPQYEKKRARNELTKDELKIALAERNNVALEYQMLLRVRKT